MENLVYACFRCNTYKGDFWPSDTGHFRLWNPRLDAAEKHLRLLADGSLQPLTPEGQWTSSLLQLNRPPLIAHRLLKLYESDDTQRLARLEKRLKTLEDLCQQHAKSMQDQIDALLVNQKLLAMLLRGDQD